MINMVKCLAQQHKFHDQDSNPHPDAFPTELESDALSRLATAPHPTPPSACSCYVWLQPADRPLSWCLEFFPFM